MFPVGIDGPKNGYLGIATNLRMTEALRWGPQAIE